MPEKGKVSVIKKKDDPISLRISIGGDLDNCYFVYRGDLQKIKTLLGNVTAAVMSMEKEPPVSDDMGKKYA